MTPTSTSPTADGRWPIQFEGSTWVGERGRTEIRYEHATRQTVRAPGRTTQRHEVHVSVRLEADYEVLALDDEGDARRVRYVVRDFVEVVDGHTTRVVPRGESIELERARRADHSSVIVGRVPASAAQRRALSVVQGLVESDRPRHDWRESVEPRRVGEHWQPNLDVVVDTFDDELFDVPRDAASGDVTLSSHRRVGDRDVLGMAATFAASRLDLRRLGRGAVATESGIDFRWQAEQPADVRPEPGTSTSEMNTELHWRIEQPTSGGTGVIEFRSTTSRSMRTVQTAR